MLLHAGHVARGNTVPAVGWVGENAVDLFFAVCRLLCGCCKYLAVWIRSGIWLMLVKSLLLCV